MFILDPQRVQLGDYLLEGATAVLIDTLAEKTIEDRADAGPWPVLADVPEQRVRITIVQRLESTDLNPPPLGYGGTMRVTAARGQSDRGRVTLHADVVVLEVRYALGGGARAGGAERRITLAGVSADGVSSPLAFAPAGPGAVPPVT